MVLIVSLCVVELHFVFMNFNKGAADIYYVTLPVGMFIFFTEKIIM